MRIKADVALFLLLTVAISAIFYAPILIVGDVAAGGTLYVAGLMWSPGIAAILTTLLRRGDWSAFGWSWGGWRWNLWAYALPLAYTALAYAVIWAFALGSFAPAESVAKLRDLLGWTTAPAAAVVLGYVVLAATAGLIRGVAFALGEEIGWRGFLAPRLMARFGFTVGTLITALIWAVWHFPLLLFANYNGGTPWWIGLPCFTLLVIGSSFLLSWIRLRSASLWPCAILHASHNLFIQSIFTPLTGPKGDVTAYVVGEFGVAVPLAIAIVVIMTFASAKLPAAGATDAKMR